MAARDRLGPLREREFRLLFMGQAISQLGDGVAPLAIAFAVLELTGSQVDLGFVLAAQTIPFLLFLLVGGVWADRLPRQRVMLASDVVRGAAQGTLAVLLLSGQARLWEMIVLEALYGAGEAFFRPAAVGFMPEVVSSNGLQQANALFGMSTSVARIAGPAVAALLVTTIQPGAAIAFDAATFVLSASFLVRLKSVRRTHSEPVRQPFVRELAEGWSELRSHTWLWAIILESALFLFLAIAPFQVLGPTVAERALGGAKSWGVIMIGLGLGTIIGSSLALRFKPSRPMLLGMVLQLLLVPVFVLLAVEAPTFVIAAGAVMAGVELGLFSALWRTTVQQHVALEKLSRVSSYDWLGSVALMPLGLMLAGPVSNAIGIKATLLGSAASVLVLTAATLAIPDVRRVRNVDREQRAALSTAQTIDAATAALFPPGAVTLRGPADPGGFDA